MSTHETQPSPHAGPDRTQTLRPHSRCAVAPGPHANASPIAVPSHTRQAHSQGMAKTLRAATLLSYPHDRRRASSSSFASIASRTVTRSVAFFAAPVSVSKPFAADSQQSATISTCGATSG